MSNEVETFEQEAEVEPKKKRSKKAKGEKKAKAPKREKKPKAEKKARKPRKAAGEAATPREGTKTAGVIEMLSKAKGATVEEIQEFVGWTKTASVHGFLSGTLRKKFGLNLVAEKNKENKNVYRIEKAA